MELKERSYGDRDQQTVEEVGRVQDLHPTGILTVDRSRSVDRK